KNPDKLKIGDTIGKELLIDYKNPQPVVFVSFYPEEADDYEKLKKSLQKLRLNDSALQFEPDYNEMLGRGFKTGFLGKFHFEITTERLDREFKIKTVQSFPSVAYQVKKDNKIFIVTNAQQIPLDYDSIAEPIIKAAIITPAAYLGKILQLKDFFRVFSVETKIFGERMIVEFVMPLADFFANFDDQLKSVSEGFASFSYEQIGYQKSDLVKLEILIANEVMPGLSRIVAKERAETVGRQVVEKLKELLPRQQFVQALQASANGRIVARENIPALKKDVTGYLYGGDRTRKMKLWKKQQRGKKRLKEIGRVDIPADVYRKLI
ncbi:MAG: elongation factor 4, partial [Candidatus Brennerbacteria bacterium]|nr:elongation factor 4 [Candidatus Brennerbacteria bacterium]